MSWFWKSQLSIQSVSTNTYQPNLEAKGVDPRPWKSLYTELALTKNGSSCSCRNPSALKPRHIKLVLRLDVLSGSFRGAWGWKTQHRIQGHRNEAPSLTTQIIGCKEAISERGSEAYLQQRECHKIYIYKLDCRSTYQAQAEVVN